MSKKSNVVGITAALVSLAAVIATPILIKTFKSKAKSNKIIKHERSTTMEHYCKRCGSKLNDQDQFEPMDWDWYECNECGEIFYNGEFICPHCNSILNNQEGFNPNKDYHKCTDCGMTIYADDVYSGEKFKNVYWHCEHCGALLNSQDKFNDKMGFWYCLECKHKNMITEENIIKPNSKSQKNNKKNSKKNTNSNKKINNVPSLSTMDELDSLIGLDSVKTQIRRMRAVLLKNKGKTKDLNLHMCFYGNPGTGKTKVARLIANILYELGVLPSNKLIETDRAGLVAEYIGQTAPKTHAKVQEAIGGVLFIDEAYTLSSSEESGNDFGKEAIAALLKDMEDYKGKFCVILAGYKEEMEDMISTNPGFDSRINRKIDFPDYTNDELIKIFKLMLKEKEYDIDNDCIEQLSEIFEECSKDFKFANARTVRNILDSLIEIQSVRTIEDDDPTNDYERIIKKEDIIEYLK